MAWPFEHENDFELLLKYELVLRSKMIPFRLQNPFSLLQHCITEHTQRFSGLPGADKSLARPGSKQVTATKL